MDAFGSNYVMMRHEDFCKNPIKEIDQLYQMAGNVMPQKVRSWATQYVKPAREPYECTDSRWQKTFDRLRMKEALEIARY